MSGLDARVVVERARHRTDLALRAEPGDVVAVVGPNGAGKTTLLHALAGLVPVADGTIRVGDRVWADATRALPVPDRDLGMVFQGRDLFPHLSARDNVAFGLRTRGRTRRAARAVAQEWLDRLGVGDLADRRPEQLSGGQAQRVAIARALAPRPAVLLLDEPLAALDVRVATALRIELAQHLAAYDGVCVLVTHDALDALTLATRVVVLDEGRVAQEGTPAEVSQRPQTAHVARLVGLNVLRGRGAGDAIVLPHGGVITVVEAPAGEALAAFPPSAVTLHREEPAGSARNRWRAEVRSLAPHGGAIRVHLSLVGEGQDLIADLTPGSATELGLVPGVAVWASVKAVEVTPYAASPTR